MRLALVLADGALGSGARYLVAVWMANRFGSTFPWGTLTVNVAGGFLIGLLATMADELGSSGPQTRAFLVVGVLGGVPPYRSRHGFRRARDARERERDHLPRRQRLTALYSSTR